MFRQQSTDPKGRDPEEVHRGLDAGIFVMFLGIGIDAHGGVIQGGHRC